MSDDAAPLRGPGGEIRPVPETWFIPQDEVKRFLEAELRAETADGHPLFGETVTAIAQCPACDDVVFRVEGDYPSRFALVHLTWRKSREPLPWPTTELLELPLAESLRPYTHLPVNVSASFQWPLGAMLWLRWKMLSGSYASLTAVRRACWVSEYARRTPEAPSSLSALT